MHIIGQLELEIDSLTTAHLGSADIPLTFYDNNESEFNITQNDNLNTGTRTVTSVVLLAASPPGRFHLMRMVHS
jgi:hypothetical protein